MALFGKTRVWVAGVGLAVVVVGLGLAARVDAATTTYYVALAGNDSNPCSQAQPCLTLNHAYQIAAAGDVIEVSAGAYASQTLASKGGAAAPNIIIKPATGATVTLDNLTTDGSYVTIKNMTIPTGSNHGRGWHSSGSHLVLDNVDVTGPWANVYLDGGVDVTWKNSSMGTPGNTQKRICGAGDTEPVELTNIDSATISNIDFFPFIPDLQNDACGVPPNGDRNMHLETVRVNDGVQHMRLERSRFHRGDGSGTARLFITKLGGANSDNITVVNNWFGTASGVGGGSYSVAIHPNQNCNNYIFAYNYWEDGFDPNCGTKNSLKMVGNTGALISYACNGTTNIKNLWVWPGQPAPGSCGSDAWIDTPSPLSDDYFDVSNLKFAPEGYHLLSDSPEIDAGESTECMILTGGVDIDGDPRSGICDAGPDEYGASAINFSADLDSDGDVDAADLTLLKADYGKLAGVAITPAADINSDGKINVFDLGILLKSWGQ